MVLGAWRSSYSNALQSPPAKNRCPDSQIQISLAHTKILHSYTRVAVGARSHYQQRSIRRKALLLHYKTGLLNTLIALRPIICLEIGTYYGGTTKIFEYYFRKYEPKGVLITADIRKYINLTSKRVRQVLVYPHVCNICKYHDITPDQLLPDFEMHFDDSVEANCEILRKELKAVGAECFDFCFVDGDHQEVSFLRDLQIARLLSRPPHYTLIDDTKDEIHECAIVYKRLMNEVNHYDFDDWPIFVGMSLIWY
jgi:hypothetical protein